jgi:dolichol-phosphate mannosyltransferase
MRKSLTVVMPSHNEGKIVGEAVSKVLSLFSSGIYDVIVHVVLDGIDFDSVKSLNDLDSSNVIITELNSNYGKGFCLRLGAKNAKSEFVAFLDADLDIEPTALLEGLGALEKKSIGCAYGSKFHPNSKLIYPPIRVFASRSFKLLVRMLFRLNIDDTQTGVKVFRNSDLQKVISSTFENHFLFDLELMILLNRLGVKMVPVPVDLNYKYSSSIGIKSIVVLGAQTIGLFLRHVRKGK